MKRLLIFFIVLCCMTASAQYYKPDVLGDDFEQHTFVMPDDYHGAVVSTLVRKMSPSSSQRAVLYVHGYNDYFFQREMAQQFVDKGYNFYAIDLRKYGRSLLPEQHKYEARDLSEYYADIDSAMCVIEREGNSDIVLMGHSTGGLITSLYCHHKGDSLSVDALILNSPFFEWNFNGFTRNIIIPLVSFIGKYCPDTALPVSKNLSTYGISLLEDYKGEWTFNTNWKSLMSGGEYFGWIRAIDQGHKIVHKEMNLDIPILLMHSDKSISGKKWTPEFQISDAVLNVEHIAKYGKMIGDNVSEVVVVDGLHDLVLSRKDVREKVYIEMFNWLNNQVLNNVED